MTHLTSIQANSIPKPKNRKKERYKYSKTLKQHGRDDNKEQTKKAKTSSNLRKVWQRLESRQGERSHQAPSEQQAGEDSDGELKVSQARMALPLWGAYIGSHWARRTSQGNNATFHLATMTV
jgi:hypothetical protein